MRPAQFYKSATYYSDSTQVRVDFITTDETLQGYASDLLVIPSGGQIFSSTRLVISARQGVKNQKGEYHNTFTISASPSADWVNPIQPGSPYTVPIYGIDAGTVVTPATSQTPYPRILFTVPTPLPLTPPNKYNPTYGIGPHVDLRSLARYGYLGYYDSRGIYMALFEAVIHTTYGGRSARNTSVCRIPFTSSLAIGNAAYAALATGLTDQFKTILIASKTINRIILTPVNADGSKKVEKNNFMRFTPGIAGTRTIAAGVDPAIDQVCALFNKNAGFGGGGSILVRGCYTEAEIASNTSREVATVSGFTNTVFTNFAANLPGVFTANSCQMILPGSNPLNVLEGARNVVTMDYGGPVLRQANRNRKSIATEEREVAARKIHEAERQYEDAVRDNGGSVIDSIIDFFIDLIKPVIQQYGVTLVLKYIGSAVLRSAVRALPALAA